MSDFPDPDEEYELMYADELAMLEEDDDLRDVNIIRPKVLPAKRSLDFSSPASRKSAKSQQKDNEISLSQSIQPLPCSLETNIHDLHTEKIHQSTEHTNESKKSVQTLSTETNATENGTFDSHGSSKRTVNDLFGDVGDIDFDEIALPSKKQKTEEENDLDLINKILEGRRLRQVLAEPMSKTQANSKPAYNTKDNISLDIPRWSFMPMTNSDGDRIYIRLESEESWDNNLDMAPEKMSLHSMYSATWEEARKLLEDKQELSAQEPQLTPIEVVHDSLWVDKYRPDSYLDLLSEEPVNRALLHWLHLWDKIVFKKEVKTRDPQQRNSFVKRTGQFQMTNKWKGKKESEPEMDDDGRPHHKVALLCGPPGVGKTTLAHLLARLAGYRPVELNASDERSTDAFRNALQSATLMRSVLDAERRPNCLILDEIDGAPLPTVELLVRWCTATAETGKKKAKSQPLRRPVIAICNDLYATSLRPLRPVSLVVHVGGVSVARLAARLARVARCEALAVAPHVCVALATRAAGDVRAAIQVLSFIRAKARAQLSIEDVENSAIGTKDCNKSMLQALQAIFTVNDKDPQAIMKIIQSAGDYDRLADGIFENYLTARVDARLLIATETLSWLRLHDVLHSWTLRNQNYTLYGALPLCIMRCHQLLASRAPQRIKFPMQAQEMYRRKVELGGITTSVLRGAAPSVACSRKALELDLLPMLPHVLKVALRSANVQLCSETERKALTSCAGAMCDYGLQYVQQRTPEGHYAFVLEPDIYKVAFFGNEEKSRPPPAIRQAISREQQLEIIRRNEQMANRVSNKAASQPSKRKSAEINTKEPVKDKETRLPNHLQRLKPKEVERSTPQDACEGTHSRDNNAAIEVGRLRSCVPLSVPYLNTAVSQNAELADEKRRSVMTRLCGRGFIFTGSSSLQASDLKS